MRPPRLLTLCALRFTHALKNMRIHPESAASPTVGQIRYEMKGLASCLPYEIFTGAKHAHP
ncbi:MAG: hypothetical protein HFE29_06250 [Clostridia bacterium]|nr:hypothetical protein [Clostridia bacterium]